MMLLTWNLIEDSLGKDTHTHTHTHTHICMTVKKSFYFQERNQKMCEIICLFICSGLLQLRMT